MRFSSLLRSGNRTGWDNRNFLWAIFAERCKSVLSPTVKILKEKILTSKKAQSLSQILSSRRSSDKIGFA